MWRSALAELEAILDANRRRARQLKGIKSGARSPELVEELLREVRRQLGKFRSENLDFGGTVSDRPVGTPGS
jgi:hypothetical protein